MSEEKNRMRLLWAGFMAILAAGVGFAIRGGIFGTWGSEYGFSGAELGAIGGAGFTGFCFGIIIGGFLVDKLGYGKLVVAAFALHVLSAFVTFMPDAEMGGATVYKFLFWGMFIFAAANGVLEAVANPLVARLFPEKRTHYLNILHASWPAGLVLGGMCGWILGDKLGWGWKEQLSLYLIPTVMYGWMFFGQKFPKSEASEKGLGLGEMFRDVGVLGALVVAYLLVLFFSTNLGMDKASAWMLGVLLVVVAGVMTRRQTEIPAQSWMLLMMCGLLAIFAQIAFNLPHLGTLIIAAALMVGMGVTMRWAMGAVLLFVLFITHALVGAVELGTDQWIQNITGNILSTEQGKILFVFTSMMMFGLRFCAGWIEEKLGLSPIGILFVCAVLACLGLNLASGIETFAGAFVALAIYGIGKTFFWPTMLAVASDRYPRTGAIAISIMGGIGMLSAGLIGSPGLGYSKDRFAGEALKAESEAVYAQYQNEGTSKFLFFSEARGLDAKKMGEVQGKLASARKILPKDGYDDEKKRLEKEQKANETMVEKLKKDGEALEKESDEIAEKLGGAKEWESGYDELRDKAAAHKKELEENAKETEAAQKAVDDAVKGLSDLDALKATLVEAEVFKAEGNSNKNAALAALTSEERMAHRASIAGDRKTLVADSFIPAIMAVIYLLMMLYFKSIGGYKPVTIDRKVEE
ncbi:MAG: MFS transporter [Limisphaerales bacterium]|nr:MFS transporter [Verrucomicrobiota bacterium]